VFVVLWTPNGWACRGACNCYVGINFRYSCQVSGEVQKSFISGIGLALIAGFWRVQRRWLHPFPMSVRFSGRRRHPSERAGGSGWFIVSLLITLSYRDVGARFGFLTPAAYTAGCFTASLLSIRYGTGGWTRFDRNCILGAGFGLALWVIFDSPMSALLINLFMGSSPHFGFFLGRCPAACCGVLH